MAESCPLSLDIAFDCAVIENPTVKDNAYLLPYNDLTGVVYNSTDTYKLDSIGLVVGSQAVKYGVASDQIKPTVTSLLGSNGTNGFNHSLSMTLPTKNAAVREELRLLVNKKMVLVVQSGSGEFLVYGLGAGLKVSELSNTRGDENGDVITLTMATGEGVKEPTMEVELLATDEATTLALMEALLVTQV